MTSTFVENWLTQARKGVLELGVLNALARERLYGYEIVKRLRGIPGLVIGEGVIYPIMSRLEREQLVQSSLEASPGGPARKYYELTPAGRRVLAEINRMWAAINSGIKELESGQ